MKDITLIDLYARKAAKELIIAIKDKNLADIEYLVKKLTGKAGVK